MYVVGIDENGLGPLLGPLVVTGVILEIPGEYDPAVLARALSGEVRVDDSKRFMAFGKVANGERTALAFLDRLPGGRPTSADALLERLALPSPACAGDCPDAAAALCRGPDLVLPHFDDPAAVDLASAGLASRLETEGVRFVDALCIPLCPRDFNQLVDTQGGKLALDLYLFEQLILAVHARLDTEALYLCGKIGSRKAYRPVLSLLKRFRGRVVREERAQSEYEVSGLGRLLFVRDGDALHPSTALASVIGKYVRELQMLRINRFLSGRLPDLRPASGYRDPVTRALVDRSAALRNELSIPDSCFLRKR